MKTTSSEDISGYEYSLSLYIYMCLQIFILTNMVATLLGNTQAIMAKLAVTNIEHPIASTVRHRKHMTMYVVPSGLLSNTLK